MKKLSTSLDINASAENVWAVLSDFEKYGEWNPFIVDISGEAIEGDKFQVTMRMKSGKEMKFEPIVMVLSPDKELRWKGKLFVKGIFDGEHAFKIVKIDENRIHLEQEEKFTGVLVPFLGKKFYDETLESFKMTNEALKERAEKLESVN